MDICFVGQRDYRGFLRDVAPDAFRPGPVVDSQGTEVGVHDGIADFTVGQRRGLGVAVGEPRFVIRIEGERATVVIGSRDQLAVDGVALDQITWTDGDFRHGAVMAQYRAHGDPVPASIDGALLSFTEPQQAIAPGQTVAFYDDDVVLGGALIASTA